MNYDHLYHAGSITDILKHSFLCALFDALLDHKKLHIIDTHGGAGLYDMNRPEIHKTKEAAQGVLKLISGKPETEDLRFYINLLHDFQNYMKVKFVKGRAPLAYYPGSPLIAQSLMRSSDHLSVCEMHPPVFKSLKTVMSHNAHVHLYPKDGLSFLLQQGDMPGKILALIDPPYENTKEELFCKETILSLLSKKGRDATVALWHPIKNPSRTFELYQNYRSDLMGQDVSCLVLEILWDQSFATQTLAGTGLMIFNPPLDFQVRSKYLLQDIVHTLSLQNKAQARVFNLA